MTDRERWRLRRSAALHAFAVVIFGMLALAGTDLSARRAFGLSIPFIVAGLAGAVGAAIIARSVWRAQDEAAGAATTGRSGAPQRAVRLAMGAASVLVLASGVALAPQGIDRGFVIWVAALLAAALALFALLSGDRPRTTEKPT